MKSEEQMQQYDDGDEDADGDDEPMEDADGDGKSDDEDAEDGIGGGSGSGRATSSPRAAAAISASLAKAKAKMNPKEFKQKLRLEKKKLKARETRKRQKEYIQSLEDKKARLLGRLSMLEEGFDSKFNEDNHRMKQQQVKRKMAEYVREGQDDQSLATMLSHFTSNSRKRQRLAEYYISKVGECIVPEQQSTFMLWLHEQTDEQVADPNGLFEKVMVKHCGLSDKQIADIKAFRADITRASHSLSTIQERLTSLRDRVREVLHTRHSNVDQISNFLTDKQRTQFCVWVDQNPVLVAMLDHIWTPKVGEDS